MKTFKEEYETQIEPYLKQIDIFLKTKKPPYSISDWDIWSSSAVCEIE